MGYSREEMYKNELDIVIDQKWVIGALRERGDFAEIHVINAVPGVLQRDVFLGLKLADGDA